MSSILTSIKKLIGITEEDENFDADIITYINSVLAVLVELGVDKIVGFIVDSDDQTWEELIPDNIYKNYIELRSLIKIYTFLKVKLIFDPPLSTSTVETINQMIKEYEWRISNMVDEKKEEKTSV